MQKVILTTGLPASGKSTYAHELIVQSGGNLIGVSRDEIRKMIGCFPIGNKEQEDLVSKIQDDIIIRGIKEGKNVIVHDTNLNKKSPTRIKKLFDGDVEFAIADFTDVPIETCIERDAKRENPVGEKVIRNMARQLQKPWRLTPEFMNDITLSDPLVHDPALPNCVVFDVDGTLAKHVARSPYDYSRVLYDAVFNEIAMLTRMYSKAGYKVFIMSGRPGKPQIMKDTITWLSDANIYYDQLVMRGADDSRNDADVKQEMVDLYIRGKYNVLIWFDDRDRVVRRLRKLNIKVAQVAYGDF
jgi:predicted kinase